mmetsp:Transcript_120594/g.257542  ORF Transcript_120594/g.257542 Transcript_120594/m.257542 type:complete len:224 (+) Transcript_120594:111-782(+)
MCSSMIRSRGPFGGCLRIPVRVAVTALSTSLYSSSPSLGACEMLSHASTPGVSPTKPCSESLPGQDALCESRPDFAARLRPAPAAARTAEAAVTLRMCSWGVTLSLQLGPVVPTGQMSVRGRLPRLTNPGFCRGGEGPLPATSGGKSPALPPPPFRGLIRRTGPSVSIACRQSTLMTGFIQSYTSPWATFPARWLVKFCGAGNRYGFGPPARRWLEDKPPRSI